MDELDESMTNALSGINDTIHLTLDARYGELEPGEMTLTLRGETRAEALGNAYHIRDVLQEEGYTADAEYIGPADVQPDWCSVERHEVRLSWDDK